MADSIAFDIKIGNATSLADLKKLWKEQQEELSKAVKGTNEYNQALKNLGKVKDEIGDLKETISALNPEGKVAAFSNVAGKLASGFQAATGAAALFGTKAEDVEKALLKVQAATAFAEGIRSLTGLKDAFAVLGTVIKANPIFAIASVIAAVAAAVISLTTETKDLNAEIKKQNDILNYNVKGLERQVELLQAQGASEEKILKVKKELIALKIQEIENSKSLQTEQLKEIQNNKTWYESLIAGLGFFNAANNNQVERAKETNDAIKKSNQEVADLKQQLIIDQAKADKSAADKRKELADKEAADELKRHQDAQARQADVENAEIDKEEAKKKKAKDDAAEEKKQFEEIANQSKADEDEKAEGYIADRKKAAKEQTDIEKAAAEEQKNAKIQAVSQGFAAAKGLTDIYFAGQLARAKGNQAEELKIRKKMFEVDKAFSIARAVIDGVRSVQAALTLPPPAGYILAAANGVLAAVNIAKIASAKFDGGSASASSDFSVPSTSGNIPAPPSPPTTIQTTTSLDRNGNNLSRQQPSTVRAIVVETDITESQDRVSKLERQARF